MNDNPRDNVDRSASPGRCRRAIHPGQIPSAGWRDIFLRVNEQLGR